ncbi:hypothetical protein BS47DRAFT_1348696 [Hydnum rufescens UP504]|uniref:Uncharacterized protein n=1 Tax=Hydnum rufescens UP504 TaxID=1448309 RepID=A0A9P6DQC0_9AGAM|nr:hypothetical protein BS47DRAFT_1348696 [Hydnum rufescens UP504]
MAEQEYLSWATNDVSKHNEGDEKLPVSQINVSHRGGLTGERDGVARATFCSSRYRD